MTEYAKEKKIKTPDGTIMYILDNKVHSWDGPAIKYPKSLKKKEEYYLYGIHYTKEQWDEFRKNREGLPYFKTTSFKGERI